MDDGRIASAPAWGEPPGPHVPGALRRLSPLAWAFVVLAVFHAVTGVSELIATNPLAAPWQIASASGMLVGDVAVLLAPVALLRRAPDAMRHMPAVLAGIVVIGLDPVLRWALGWLTPWIADGDSLSSTMLGLNAIAILGQAVALLGIVLFVAGTWAAMGRPRPAVDRTLVAIAAAVGTATLANVAYLISWTGGGVTDDLVAGLVAVTGGGVAGSWGVLAWVALRARRSDPQRVTAWTLLAAAGLLLVLGALLASVVGLVATILGPGYLEVQQGPLVLLGIIGPASSLAFLAAVALGVPRPAGDA